MKKKKAFKIAAASVMTASSFAAVAPFSQASAAVNVAAYTSQATNQMYAAFNSYAVPAAKGQAVSAATVQKQVDLATKYYNNAVSVINRYAGKQKSYYLSKLAGSIGWLNYAKGYVAAKSWQESLNSQAIALQKAVNNKDINTVRKTYFGFSASLQKALGMKVANGYAQKAFLESLSFSKSVASQASAFFNDHTAPVIKYTGSYTDNVVSGAAYTVPTLTATDNYDKSVTVTRTITDSKGTKLSSIDTKTPGTYTVTYSAKDAAGNAAKSVVLTVIVASPVVASPVITGVSAVNDFQVTEGSQLTNLPTATVNYSDGSSKVVTVKWDTTSVNVNKAGKYPITGTIDGTDKTASVNVVVVDKTAPVITLNGDQKVTLTFGTAYTEAGATVKDNNDQNIQPTVTITDANGNAATIDGKTAGTYTVTYTAVDAAGNKATPVTRTVVVAPLAVSSVGAITKTSVKVTLASAPAADFTNADAKNFDVEVNGTAVVPTAVAKDATDLTGKTYTLTFPSLDGQEGALSVNGVEPTVKAGTSTNDFDFKAPTIASVTAVDAKHIKVVYSEQVSQQGAEDISNYSLFNYSTNSLVDLSALTGDSTGAGTATAKLQADGKTVVITFSGHITNNGFVVNGLTNGQYLLYVDQSATNKVQDLASNQMTANSNSQFAGTTTPEQGSIQAQSAVYNKAAKTLSVTFNEPTDGTTADVTKFALTDGTTTASLKGATPSFSANNTVVTFNLGAMADADYANVAALAGNVSVNVTDGAYKDANGLAAKGNTVAATQTVLPVATAAEYNEATNVLKLTFDNQIDISKIVSFAGLKVNGVDVSSGATLKTTANSNVVEVQLSDATAAAMESDTTFNGTALRTNTVTNVPVVVPAGMVTKVGATTADPGKNLSTTIAKATVDQDTIAPTVTANLKGLGTATGTLTLTASEALDLTIAGSSISFYTSDNLTTPVGTLSASDTTLTAVPNSNAYTVNLANNDGTLATALSNAVASGKTIVMTIGKGAVKDLDLTDINAVTTTSPLTVSVAEANYGASVATVAPSSATSNLVDVSFKDSTSADVQLDKAVAEGNATYQFVSVANPNIVVNATAKYVWDSSAQTGVLHVIPNSTLINGQYKLVLTGLKTNAGKAVEDATTPGVVTLNPVTIAADTTPPTLSSTAIALADKDNSGTLSAGDTLTVKFNEPVKLDSTRAADDFSNATHSLGSSTVALGSDPSVVVITLASDSTIALGDTLAVNQTAHITDLAGNQVAAAQTTAAIAKPAGVTAPIVKSEVYADTNNDGVVDKGDTLTVTFDQAVKAADGAVLTNDITLPGATFANPVLSGSTLTLTIDTPPTNTAIVGQTATVRGTDILNSWNDQATTGSVVTGITSADTTSPKVVSVAYGTEGTNKFLYVTMSEAVHLGATPTFGNVFTVDQSTGTIASGDVLSLDSNDATNKTIKVALVAGDNVIAGLTNVNVLLAPSNVLDASGNTIQKSTTAGYTVTQK